MKTSETRQVISNLEELVSFAARIHGFNYSIKESRCIDESVNLKITDPVSPENTVEVRFILRELRKKDKLCIIPRILSLDIEKYMHEIEVSMIIQSITKCLGSKYFIIINDVSKEYLLASYFLRRYNEIYSSKPQDLLVFSKYVLNLVNVKELVNAIKDIERKLKVMYDERAREEYLEKTNILDHYLPNLVKLWEENRQLFDSIQQIINNEDKSIEEIIAETLRRYGTYKIYVEQITEEIMKKIEELTTRYPVDKINFVRTSELTTNNSSKEILDTLEEPLAIIRKTFTKLREMHGCLDIVVIDGQEYMIIRSISGEEFIPINVYAVRGDSRE